jgi:hypothetical protein
VRTRLRRLLPAIVLAGGWAAAVAVFLLAAPVQEDADVYDLTHSRRYERQLQVIGGKAAVMGNEINDWLASLWHGKRLAYTIAAGTAVVALVAWACERAARAERQD